MIHLHASLVSGGKLLREAVRVIKAGLVCLTPTDTTYALAADCENEYAIEMVAELKGREMEKPFSIMVGDLAMIEKYAELEPWQRSILARNLPGRFTFLLSARPKLSSRLVAENRIGVRVPNYKLVRDLCKACKVGLTATSANITSQPAAYNVTDFLVQVEREYLLKGLACIIDAGQLKEREPSTIIDLVEGNCRVVRRGGVREDSLRRLMEEIRWLKASSS